MGLQRSGFASASLDAAVLDAAIFNGAVLQNAQIKGASLSDTTSHGFTKEQFYSTDSYLRKQLFNIRLGHNDLSGWDFHAIRMAGADFEHSDLSALTLSAQT